MSWLPRCLLPRRPKRRTQAPKAPLLSREPFRARARATQSAYERELLRVVDATAAGLPGKSPTARRKLAWAVLAILSGGVTLARAVNDPKVSAQIAGALKTTIDGLVSGAAP
jgi:TetR/AcrR family transcriptional regulator, transcriptional repressor for nem operon